MTLLSIYRLVKLAEWLSDVLKDLTLSLKQTAVSNPFCEVQKSVLLYHYSFFFARTHPYFTPYMYICCPLCAALRAALQEIDCQGSIATQTDREQGSQLWLRLDKQKHKPLESRVLDKMRNWFTASLMGSVHVWKSLNGSEAQVRLGASPSCRSLTLRAIQRLEAYYIGFQQASSEIPSLIKALRHLVDIMQLMAVWLQHYPPSIQLKTFQRYCRCMACYSATFEQFRMVH